MATQHNGTIGPEVTGGRCADIQELLFDFVSHELEASRADIVRRHLARCPECRRQAAELRETIAALRAATADAEAPAHVSAERREQFAWSIMHPFRDWLRRHHLLVSLVLAAILVAVIWLILRRVTPVQEDPVPEGIEVEIGGHSANP